MNQSNSSAHNPQPFFVNNQLQIGDWIEFAFTGYLGIPCQQGDRAQINAVSPLFYTIVFNGLNYNLIPRDLGSYYCYVQPFFPHTAGTIVKRSGYTSLPPPQLIIKDMPIGVPFVAQGPLSFEYYLIRVNDNEVGFYNELMYGVSSPISNDSAQSLIYSIIDWFEAEEVSQPSSSICSCDFYNVILPMGCQCGGK